MQNKPLIFFFRILFPSWKFFDFSGSHHSAFFRHQPPGGEWSEWTPLLPTGVLSGLRTVWNPRGNARLAATTIVQELLADAAELSNVRHAATLEHSVPYQLLKNWSIQAIPSGTTLSNTQLQFKISEDAGDLLVSKIYGALE